MAKEDRIPAFMEMERGMKGSTKKKFWTALAVFGLMGQIAWVVENMYLNVFIYKMFHASAGDISLMVGASSVAATLTTILMGAYSDYVGKRKRLICGGYILWGISILGFALVRMDTLTPLMGSAASAASLGISLVIALDCLMTFLGSTANDAAFNAWMTDWGDGDSRGRIEGINAMMPLVATLVVFGGFMAFDLDQDTSWAAIFVIIGCAVLTIGVLGLFLVQDRPKLSGQRGKQGYWQAVLYSFRPSVFAEHKLLYAVIGAFALFNISINIYMPYLILYYEKGLGMADYVIVMAPAIILAAVITAFYGKLFDLMGFQSSVLPSVGMLMAGYVILYYGRATAVVFVGSLLMMSGYLTGMAVFGAMIRNHIPEQKAGQFQGIRIIGQVLLPGMIGPAIGAAVLHDADVAVNNDGTMSFIPDQRIFSAAFLAAVVLLLALYAIFYMMKHGHRTLVSEAGERILSGGQSWDSYPRPQLRRDEWTNLNQGWRLNGRAICVPFPPQSLLSGYGARVGAKLEYTCEFMCSRPAEGRRVLLHFGAVDQIAEVFLNGKRLGRHEGGYLPFTFDVTEALAVGEYERAGSAVRAGTGQRNAVKGSYAGERERAGSAVRADASAGCGCAGIKQELRVCVTDTLSHVYPYGKQRKRRGGMWYTPVSGIWQSVWLEAVPERYIRNLRITPDAWTVRIEAEVVSGADAGVAGGAPGNCVTDAGSAPAQAAAGTSGDVPAIRGTTAGHDGSDRTKQTELSGSGTVSIRLPEGGCYETALTNGAVRIDLREIVLPDGTRHTPRQWSQEDPYLYRAAVTIGEDRVETYFALREVGIRKVDGVSRVCLNGKPVFLNGVLDQGYFCDGIWLPAEEAEYERDILRMQELGINLLRKHIKVEPECFYYYCDLHGMLVMQDIVNNGSYSFLRDTAMPTIGQVRRDDTKHRVPQEVKRVFEEQMKQEIRHLYNHPCIIAYTIFNEGWGQFESDRMYELARQTDPGRLYDATSGWFAQTKSDFDSYHVYFGKEKPVPGERPMLMSEFGGFSYAAPKHCYAKYSSYGYGVCKDTEELMERIRARYEELLYPVVEKGLCGCVYTQVSDVEDEINGFYTYDRRVCKVDPVRMREIAGMLRTLSDADDV